MTSPTQGRIAVLGAGIVGTSVALELARRGRDVVLVDPRPAGEETSYGNAGVIEAGNYLPIGFPMSPRELVRHVLRRDPGLHFYWRTLPRIAPWLASLALNSRPAARDRTGAAIETLLVQALDMHRARLAEGGRSDLLRETGWLHLFRTKRGHAGSAVDRALADATGFPYRTLDPDGVRELEPHLRPGFRSAVFWPTHASASDPGAVTRNIFELFRAAGGAFRQAAVTGLVREGDAWTVRCGPETESVAEVVVAMGPWSPDIIRPLGLALPLAVKRGYHLHYRPEGNASLSRPVLDAEGGYVLAPMTRGIRLTTGIEFADRDDPPSNIQILKTRLLANEIFPLGDPVEDMPWMGRRPCFADSRPVIGPAPGRPGLWLCFGHGHLGFTLGPVSGALMAQLMTGEAPLADPAPFSATRFAGLTA